MFGNLFRNFNKNFDYLLFSMVMALTAFGIVCVYSATYSYDDNIKFIIVQITAVLIGVFLMFVLISIDYEFIKQIWAYLYGFSIIMLVAVLLLGTGLEETGGNRWFRLGPINFQPSEIVKIFFVIVMAYNIEKHKETINRLQTFGKIFLFLLPLFFLIALQPDLGTNLTFIFIFAIMMYIGGLSYKYYIAGGAICTVMLPAAWFLMHDYQRERIMVFLNPENDPLGAGYHVIQSKIAIGSGGLWGKGFLQGSQTQMDILPAKHTDFIFSVVGEEFGIIGCLIVCALLFGIIIRCFAIATQAKDDFGTLLCVGIASMLLFHSFENIGMCMGLMPVTGIPLPFFSYGGSSIISNFIAVGLVMNIKYRCRVINF